MALVLFGCKSESDDYAYIGGEIINPNADFVVISKADVVLDTIKLDTNNRFLYKVDHLETGIYTFKHGGEMQMVLLEPKDSIVFRLNTLDFDESLVFTGDGDKKNNYLINDFLHNEIEQKLIFKFCQLDPQSYVSKIDSLKAEKKSKLKMFQEKYNPSELFSKIANTSIEYNYYTNKEIYPFVHYGESKREILKSLPKDFYAYRKDINYNNDLNKDYFNYNSFLRSTFNNLALSEHLNHVDDSEEFTPKSLDYNLVRLKMVDSLITNQSIKNELLYNYTIYFLTKNTKLENNDVILKSFLSKSDDVENKSIVTSVVKSLNKLKPGNKFPDIQLLDLEDNEANINSLTGKPSVIYFWSNSFYDHFKDSHHKAKELTAKYPEINFVAINIDDENPRLCIESMKKNKLSFQHEFKFKNPKEGRLSLAVYPMTKSIILDKENKIVNPNTNIFDIRFEEQLLGLINR